MERLTRASLFQLASLVASSRASAFFRGRALYQLANKKPGNVRLCRRQVVDPAHFRFDIGGLTPFRETLVLRDIEGLDYREIAEATEVPIGTVMSRLARARRRLIATIGKE
jgi:hypothetical protein